MLGVLKVAIIVMLCLFLYECVYDWFIDTRTEEERQEYTGSIPYGLIWLYEKINKKYSSKQYLWDKIPDKVPMRKHRAVICVETGAIFKNCARADEFYMLPKGTTNKIINGVRPHGIGKNIMQDGRITPIKLTFREYPSKIR